MQSQKGCYMVLTAINDYSLINKRRSHRWDQLSASNCRQWSTAHFWQEPALHEDACWDHCSRSSRRQKCRINNDNIWLEEGVKRRFHLGQELWRYSTLLLPLSSWCNEAWWIKDLHFQLQISGNSWSLFWRVGADHRSSPPASTTSHLP